MAGDPQTAAPRLLPDVLRWASQGLFYEEAEGCATPVGEPASGVLDLGFSVSGSYLTTSWARAQFPVLGGSKSLSCAPHPNPSPETWDL